MKRFFRPMLWGILLLCLALVGAGCQPIGGVDLNKALLRSFDTLTSEGNGDFTLEFTFNDKAGAAAGATDQELQILKAISPLTIHFDQMKTEGTQQASMKGSLIIPRGKIPFEASITPDELIFQVEGAAKPFVLKLNEMQSAGSASVDPKVKKAYEDAQKKMKEPQVVKPLYSYLIGAMPNPDNIKLTNVSETINGESVSLHKVEAEVNFKQLLPWLKTYFLRLMQDDEGLKAAVAQLYDALKPVFDAAISESSSGTGASSSGAAVNGMMGMGSMMKSIGELLSDRETAIEVIHTEAKQLLVFVRAALNGADDPKNPASSFWSEDSYVKGAYYIDNNLDVRKSTMELYIKVPDMMASQGVSAVKITSGGTAWNIGKAVKADVLSSEGAVSLKETQSASEVLQSVKPDSNLYHFLKDDLHITRKTASFYLPVKAIKEYDFGVYSEQDTTMVKAADFASRLGLQLQWDASESGVTLTDPANGTTLKMKIGESTALLNGKSVEAPAAAAIVKNSAYIPLRFAAEAFGGKVTFNANTHMITVTKE